MATTTDLGPSSRPQEGGPANGTVARPPNGGVDLSALAGKGRRPQPPRTNAGSVGLLTGGGDRHYAFGLATALAGQGVSVDFIGGDELDSPELHNIAGLKFFNFRRNARRQAGSIHKGCRLLAYYAKLMAYAVTARPKTFHILWNNKFELFDRTLLTLYYKLCGKKIVLTAHNVNAGIRDANDGFLNRFGLRIQYRLADQIFVHTQKMKAELLEDFGVPESAVTVIPYGINNAVPTTSLTSKQAKSRLGLASDERVILFFGNIAPYKGVDYLVTAFAQLADKDSRYRLVIAGRVSEGSGEYADEVIRALRRVATSNRVITRIEFIPDDETEVYFKAADVLALPYRHIFQSGIMFLGFSFGLPVIASDVGSLKESIVVGKTGWLFRPNDPADLAATIEKHFESSLYHNLEQRRSEIFSYVTQKHSWDRVAGMTRKIYAGLG